MDLKLISKVNAYKLCWLYREFSIIWCVAGAIKVLEVKKCQLSPPKKGEKLRHVLN